jgi:hypothetical protein
VKASDERASGPRLLSRLQGLETGSAQMGHQSPSAEFPEFGR